MKIQLQRTAHCKTVIRRKALAIAIGGSIALAFAGGAWAQAVTGTIRGKVPVSGGETIQITGGAGFNRTIPVGASGRYSITLPVGTYTVTLLQHGKAVQRQSGVSPAAAGAVEVDFSTAGGAVSPQSLGAVNVVANAIPPIDVTSTNQTTTITAKQLAQLPLGRTAENIAMLAPGVTMGSAYLLARNPTALNTPLVSFDGASVAENAYYIDGMNTTDPLTGQGGISLPYGAIEQQQTITSGYGARYGRSIGGVINQIGKSGSNDWHFGVQAIWQPGRLRNNYVNQLWNSPHSTTPGQEPGDLRTYRENNGLTENIYDAYVNGPIIRDRLTFALAVEQDNTHSNAVTPTAQPTYNQFTTEHAPKIYAKINWNINNSNVFSLTGMQSSDKQWESQFLFDPDTHKTGDYVNSFPATKNTFRTWVANYTSYITNNFTLHAMFGKTHGEYYSEPSSSALPAILSPGSQNPKFAPPGGIRNNQTVVTFSDPAHRSSVTNYRVDLNYKLGNHDFELGIDSDTSWDIDDGSAMSGPGWAWLYYSATGAGGAKGPGDNISGADPNVPPYVGPPNSNPDGDTGYYVSKYIFSNAASVRVVQRAYYLQDNWQVTPRLLLKLGLRDDTFTNYGSAGVPYLKLTKPQWEPRVGFSWDVNGDSSLKVFGNAGRYYLALPASVALREASSSLFTQQYFTYNGIDSNGIPQGLTPIPENPVGGVSQNNEYGQPLDMATIAATDIKAEYADSFVLGAQQKLHFLDTTWVAGANGVYNKLGRIIDDWGDQPTLCAVGFAKGDTWLTQDDCGNYTLGSMLFNPTYTQTFMVKTPTGGLTPVTVTPAEQGFPRKAKRDYYAINLSLEHPWDGKWWADVIYTFSRSWGNTEGPVDSTIGQAGSSVSITEQWDFAPIMQHSYGLQPNDQRHQLKVFGEYAITPEWMVGGSLYIASGHPIVCLSDYPTPVTPDYGPGSYHFCGKTPAPPGSTGFTPWLHELNLNVIYQPDWADRKLSLKLDVFNVFNNQTPLQYYSTFESTRYLSVLAWTPPRYLRFSVAYNF